MFDSEGEMSFHLEQLSSGIIIIVTAHYAFSIVPPSDM